jgi:FkbM family methyltransferase
MLYFDIGSNVGLWTLANINTADRIISVEASASTFTKLEKRCNNSKITLLNYAICNNNGEDIVFYHANNDVLSTTNKEWLTNETSRFYNTPYISIKCKTMTIDTLIEKYGKPDLIKVDVEGGEYECISSLTQKVDILCFEWASEVNDITFKCLDYLLTIGFTNFFLQFRDDYTFRPEANEYYNIETIKEELRSTEPKNHWGMIWCR